MLYQVYKHIVSLNCDFIRFLWHCHLLSCICELEESPTLQFGPCFKNLTQRGGMGQLLQKATSSLTSLEVIEHQCTEQKDVITHGSTTDEEKKTTERGLRHNRFREYQDILTIGAVSERVRDAAGTRWSHNWCRRPGYRLTTGAVTERVRDAGAR